MAALKFLVLAVCGVLAQNGKQTDSKTPILNNSIDTVFNKIATYDDSVQNAFRSHMLTAIEDPQSVVHEQLSRCTPKRELNNKIKKLRGAMKAVKMPSVKKNNFMKSWLKMRLNACADKITSKDLMSMAIELGKAKAKAEMESLDLTEEQRLEYEALKQNATARYLAYSAEATEILDKSFEAYKEAVPEEMQVKLEELSEELQADIRNRWDTEWKSQLIQTAQEKKAELFDQVENETAKDLLNWGWDTLAEEIQKRVQEEVSE